MQVGYQPPCIYSNGIPPTTVSRSTSVTVKQPSVLDVQIRKEHILNRQGKDFVRYEGLLDAAHRAGLMGISTSLVDAPSAENGQTAICHAEARFPWGVYSGIGDANKGNVGPLIAPHIIRMAETRAKARALRDGLNVGMAAVEELVSLPSDRDTDLDDGPDETHHPAPAPAARPAAPRAVQAKVTPPSPSVDAEERAKYDRLVATARRLKLDVEALPADADPTAVRTERDNLLGRVNSALQAQRATPAGNGR
jgi:hypothetical protein